MPPVSSAIFLASGWIPPPVIDTMYSLPGFGSMVSGPPQPRDPFSTRTFLNVLGSASVMWHLHPAGSGLLFGPSLRRRVQAEAGEVRDHHRQRAGDLTREEYRGNADLHGLRFGLTEGEPDR